MLAVCESCLPTLSKLRESVSGLRADLMERDKILLDFSTVAATQASAVGGPQTGFHLLCGSPTGHGEATDYLRPASPTSLW